jgi:hypothetical protein
LIRKAAVWILLGLVAVAPSLWAFPEYTSRQNAIRLAEVLDKGQYRDLRIASVFVKNRTNDEHFLQAVLEDGSSQEWRLNQIYEWALTDQLQLTGNRVLVFPSDESTEFGVLDKNEFYRMVLTSEAFVKTYGEHDLLENKQLIFGIRRFRMLHPDEEEQFSQDEQGNRFRYVLELDNGGREILTYLDAFQLMNNGAFVQKALEDDVVLTQPYLVRELVAIPRQVEDELRNIWRFGVEIIFDQNVELTPDLVPYQIVEQNLRDPETGLRKNQFFIHVMIPNAEKIREIPGFRALEYLQHVEVVTDVEHQQRVFLRAQITPQIFELPPYVEVTRNNSVVVNFFTVTDQTVTRRQQFMESRVPITGLQSAMFAYPEETEFEKHYLRAVEQIRSAQRQSNTHLKIDTYLSALASLHDAAINAQNDQEIAQALLQRDTLLQTLPDLIISNTQRKILESTKEQQDSSQMEETRRQLLSHLDRAAEFATQREQQQKIASLQNILR